MARSIAVGLVILAVSASAALAQAGPSNSDRDEYGNMRVNAGTPGVSGSKAALHAKTHRESGYKTESDYNANGTMRVDTGTRGVNGSKAALHAKTHRESGYKPKSDYNANGTMRVH